MSWVADKISKSKQEKTVTIMGLPSNNFTRMNESVSLSVSGENESLTITTYFNNAQSQLNLYESFTASSAAEVEGKYSKPDNTISYAGIILKNDIFIIANEISLGFNIYGNHHALISNQSSCMFSALGKSGGTGVRLENLDIAGTTSQKIFNDLKGTNEFDNIDFYGTVYTNVVASTDNDTIGLHNISGTHVDVYTAIYGKQGVKISVANMVETGTDGDNPNTHVKLKGVVFASDGEDGTSGTSATAGAAGKSITLTNATNMLIAVKAGDGGNGGLTLSSGLPSVLYVKAGGAAGTVTGADETFTSEAGISGGVYRSDETGNDDGTFKSRAFGTMFICDVAGESNGVDFHFTDNKNEFPGIATSGADDEIENAHIVIRSPNASSYNFVGATSQFAAFYEGGNDNDYTGIEYYLLSSGGRGYTANDKHFTDTPSESDIANRHLGKEAFKYLVLDAGGNPVYSKTSFIAAGGAWPEGIAVVPFSQNDTSELGNFIESNKDKTLKLFALGYMNNKNINLYDSHGVLAVFYNKITVDSTGTVKTKLDELLNISLVSDEEGYDEDKVYNTLQNLYPTVPMKFWLGILESLKSYYIEPAGTYLALYIYVE